MSIIEKLASSLGRRDEVPNQQLAEEIVAADNKSAVQELVENLQHKKKDIQNDCIKVLYEVGEHKALLIAPYTKEFIALLDSKNNRLQWGAMTALACIAGEDPKRIYASIGKIATAADKGSVITKDNYVRMLVQLGGVKQYAEKAFTLIIEQLLMAPTNQLPMYAEMALPLVNEQNKAGFVKALKLRLDDIDKDSKRKRVEKVMMRAERVVK